MTVTEALERRYCVRAYTAREVKRSTLLEILEAANRSPSWANTQPWEIYAAGGETLDKIRERFVLSFKEGVPIDPDRPAPQVWPEEQRKRIEELGAVRGTALGIDRQDAVARDAALEHHNRFFGAPAMVYLCMDRELTAWSLFDLGMFAQSIMLAAQERGLGSAPAFRFVAYPGIIREELGIPDRLSIVLGIALGYADENHPHNSYRSPRRPIESVVVIEGVR